MSDDRSQVDRDVALAARGAAGLGRRALVDSLRQTFRLVRESGGRVSRTSSVLQIVNAVALALQIIALRTVLSRVVELGQGEVGVADVVLPIVALAALSVLTSICSAATTQLNRLLSQLVTRRMSNRVFEMLRDVRLETFEDKDFLDRLQRVQTNALTSPLQLVHGAIDFGGAVLTSVGLIVAIELIHPLLAPIVLVAAVPLYLLSRRVGRAEFDFVVQQTPIVRERAYLSELLLSRDAAKETVAYQASHVLTDRHDSLFGRFLQSLRAHSLRVLRMNAIGTVVAAVVTIAALLGLLVLVQDKAVSLGSAGAAAIAIRLLSSRIELAFKGLSATHQAGLFLADTEELESRARPRRPRPAVRSRTIDPLRQLDVERVSFRYPGGSDSAVCDIDLTIRAGEVLALIGENGSGKTTLAKLMAGLYEPTTGSVRWNGNDLRQVDERALRHRIAPMFQDYMRYDLPARFNVGLGRSDAIQDDAAIHAAAEQAGIDEVLSALPDGLDTYLGHRFRRGRDLSGGEWQRVALARGMMRHADFLVLDEPSAALDPRAEEQLVERLRRVMAGRTVVLISHRFSTVRRADRICVMASGRIAELGTHEELIEAKGLYAELFSLQARAFHLGFDPGALQGNGRRNAFSNPSTEA